jgi:hypothetical protein
VQTPVQETLVQFVFVCCKVNVADDISATPFVSVLFESSVSENVATGENIEEGKALLQAGMSGVAICCD